MNWPSTSSRLAAGLLSALLTTWFLSGCSQTAAPQPNIVERAQGETAAPPPPPNGFLGADYGLLKPKSQDANAASIIGGQQQQAELAYVAPGVNFSQYNKVILAPVTYWADSDSTISASEQQTLCNYFYNVLVQAFSKNYALVNDPGPGTVRLQVALIDATAATPGLRTISVVVPQAHAQHDQDGFDRNLCLRRLGHRRRETDRFDDRPVARGLGRPALWNGGGQERDRVAVG